MKLCVKTKGLKELTAETINTRAKILGTVSLRRDTTFVFKKIRLGRLEGSQSGATWVKGIFM